MPVQVQLLGQSISVGRPSGYVDPSRAQEAAAAAAAALQAFQVRNVLQNTSVASPRTEVIISISNKVRRTCQKVGMQFVAYLLQKHWCGACRRETWRRWRHSWTRPI